MPCVGRGIRGVPETIVYPIYVGKFSNENSLPYDRIYLFSIIIFIINLRYVR